MFEILNRMMLLVFLFLAFFGNAASVVSAVRLTVKPDSSENASGDADRHEDALWDVTRDSWDEIRALLPGSEKTLRTLLDVVEAKETARGTAGAVHLHSNGTRIFSIFTACGVSRFLLGLYSLRNWGVWSRLQVSPIRVCCFGLGFMVLCLCWGSEYRPGFKPLGRENH